MKKLSLTLAALFLVFGTLTVNAKDKDKAEHNIKVGIPSYSLVGISSDATIALMPAAPETAGQGLDFDVESASDNSVWLNYSSIIKSSANSISVSMKGDNLPNGVTIELVAAEDAGKGKGDIGKTEKKTIVLSGDSQPVVTNIKNCYTGTGSSSGHQLTYTLKMDETSENYKALTAKDFDTTITYTITSL
ncbi:hypothetical protein [Draconibacterium halophilum]|uniref:Uncharacterized protein n=1 Tax=Draconibacterium halophilum TaxID=2706887 RepID=A0A6C0RGE8_9BACT|nr:hypothetical protein [Draconibacterium halophilum]QIA09788.1 hypothetical protein G0Q07_19690 [Draconibacterium halophilum]